MNLADKYESVAWEMRSFTAKHYDVEMVEIVNQILFELRSMLESKDEPLTWADFMLVVDMKERSLRTDHSDVSLLLDMVIKDRSEVAFVNAVAARDDYIRLMSLL